MSCATCAYCRRVPNYPQYRDAYGWCMYPMPFWVSTGQPLVRRKDFRGTCPAYRRRPPKVKEKEK